MDEEKPEVQVKPKGRHIFTKEDSIKGGQISRRPKTIKTTLTAMLESEAPDDIIQLLQAQGLKLDGDTTVLRALTARLVAEALNGSPWASKLIMEHLEGRPVESVSHEVKGIIEISKSLGGT